MAGSVPSFTVDVTGGVFEARTLSLTGELAASLLKTVSVDRLFLGTAGISPDFGLTYPGLSDLPVKRAMIGASRFVYLLADSTKIGKTCFAALGALSAIDLFITDDGIDTETVRVFEEMGVEVAVAARGTAGGRAAVQCTEEVGMRFKE